MPTGYLTVPAQAMKFDIEMKEISKKFYKFMHSIPHGEYGRQREALCKFMDWSYWQYCRRLNGETYIGPTARKKIEEFFNEKIF